MTRTSLALVHDSSASAFDPSALRDADGEPRVRDLDLAQRLGFDKLHNIRKLVQRNQAELQTHGEVAFAEGGEVSATVAENDGEGVFSTVEKTSLGGRPGKTYWLNEAQALVLCALSRTPQAALVRKALIECFLAYRRGQLPVEHEAAQSFAQLAAEVAELRQRVALIGAAPHIRATYRGGTYIPGVVGLTVRDLTLHDAFKQFLHFGKDAAVLESPKSFVHRVAKDKQQQSGQSGGSGAGGSSEQSSGGQQKNSGVSLRGEKDVKVNVEAKEDGTYTITAEGAGTMTFKSLVIKAGGVTLTMKDNKFILDGEVHLGDDGGQLLHRKGDLDSDGDAAVGSASKVYAV